MTLQGFSSRSKQGLYRSLQAFGQGTPPSRLLYGLTVGNDVVYVCDYLNHKILSYQLDGTKIDEWGTFGTTDGLIDRPVIVKWYNSEVYVCDNTDRVQVFSESGTWDRTILTNVQKFDVYDGYIFSVSNSGTAPFYTTTFKKSDIDGVLDSSFVFANSALTFINYERGILFALTWEDNSGSTDVIYYILNDDGTISTEINVDATYPENEKIQLSSFGVDATHLYTYNSDFIYKHEIGGSYISRVTLSLPTFTSLPDMDYYDGSLYLTANYNDPLVNSKVRIHSASTLAFDTEWTAT
jgi:hypothetical protein